MDKMYRAVLVGLGNIAWRFGSEESGSSLSHAAAILRNDQIQLLGGCSPDKIDREEFQQAHHIPTYADFENMLGEVDPHLVSICSPTSAHFDQVGICLKRRIPMIWLEKPPTETVAQLKELQKIHKEDGEMSHILVNFQRRYMDSYDRLRQALKEERFGAICLVEIRYSRGLQTNGSHLLDILFYILEPASYELLWVEQDGDQNNPSFTLRLENGCLVIVSGCDLPYHNIDFSVTCDKGRISILHNDMTPAIEECVEHELFPSFYRLKDQGKGFLGKGGSSFSFDAALTDLIESHETGRLPISCLETALSGQILLERVLHEASL